jgi:hypothetical protein
LLGGGFFIHPVFLASQPRRTHQHRPFVIKKQSKAASVPHLAAGQQAAIFDELIDKDGRGAPNVGDDRL